MVERFNGRISAILTTTQFRSREDLQAPLERHAKIYNGHLPQCALGHRTPRQAMERWREDHPELFVRRSKNQTGLDIYRMAFTNKSTRFTRLATLNSHGCRLRKASNSPYRPRQ